jgi:hypothetical protein
MVCQCWARKSLRIAVIARKLPRRMKTRSRALRRGRPVIATFAGAAFLWALVLTVSPQLHERIHRDANRADHACAVTFLASGNYTHSSAPLVSVPAPIVSLSAIPALTPAWVESPFLLARIFEHAPPALS